MAFFFFFAAMPTVTVITATITTTVATAILAATLAAARAIRTRHRASGPPATKSSPHTTTDLPIYRVLAGVSPRDRWSCVLQANKHDREREHMVF